MNAIINEYVDKALNFARQYEAYLMYEDHPVVAAMAVPFQQDRIAGKSAFLMMEHPQSDGLLLELAKADKYPWKTIESTVTDGDIAEIEALYNISLPDSYKYYLRYKHFYSIFFNPSIRLYAKPADDWKKLLCDPNDEMREELLEHGYFAIGDYSDHGAICLAVKDEHSDCRVVMIDYECGPPDDPEDEEVLGDHFVGFLESVLQQGAASVRELKEWEQRMHNK